MAATRQALAARLWSEVDKSGDCWLWTGAKLPFGYGQFTIAGKTYYAHRASVQLSGRDIPPGMVVMHLCDNPSCVRPQHLRVGTQAENRQDCAAKGRNPLNGNQLLTHCKRGHAFAVYGKRTGRGNQRVCTECERQRLRRRTRQAMQ